MNDDELKDTVQLIKNTLERGIYYKMPMDGDIVFLIGTELIKTSVFQIEQL